MKSFLDCALELAALGFSVFPATAGKKKPPIMKEFWNAAATDPDKIRTLWRFDADFGSGEAYNPAISTTRYGDSALIVVDIDPKHGGWDSMEDLQIIHGRVFPETYEQHTPSTGAHLVYSIREACAGSEGKLAPGLDIRSHHNYILGAGSETAAGVYTNVVRPVAAAPAWLLEWSLAYPAAHERSRQRAVAEGSVVDRRAALRKAHDFLAALETAPDGKRDGLAYKAACKLRGLGLAEDDVADQMLLWFRYQPGDFGEEDIRDKVKSAFKYATGQQGEEAPERYFAPIPRPEVPERPSPSPEEGTPEDESEPSPRSTSALDLLNKNYAFTMVGNKARVMWEFANHWGKPTREFLALEDFRAKEAGNLLPAGEGEKQKEASAKWLRWNRRRSYDSIVFAPGRQLPSRFLNTWRGFAYEPLARGEKPTDGMKEAVEMFKRLIRVNFALEVGQYEKWITAFFAHMIQKPWEKPLVAPVFKGGRGYGKSTVALCTGALVEPHFFVASDQRYLVGNFNGHMSECLEFVLEEAFWGGSKSAEAVLKEVVTGEKLTIEQKFREAFRTENYMRVIIIGNEEWQVPAALKDERRWAVFDVEMHLHPFVTDDDKERSRKWFFRMKRLMENGGYRYLMTYLQSIDLGEIDINGAPRTKGLIDQIEHTLPPLMEWWLQCLRDGRIVEGDLQGWPVEIEKRRVRDAFKRYCDGRNVTSRLPGETIVGKELHRVCPGMVLDKKNNENQWVYRFPSLPQAREEWGRVIGREPSWPDDEDY